MGGETAAHVRWAEGRAGRGAFGPLRDRRTYLVLAYLLAGNVLGWVWFALLVAGWSVTIGLAVTPLVVLGILGLGELARLAATAERRLAHALLGVRLADSRRPRAGGFWGRPAAVLRDRSFWREQAFLLLRPFVAFPLAALLWWTGEALVSPVTYRWGWPDYGFWRPDTFPEALLVSLGGAALLLAGLHLVRPFGALARGLARRLLAGDAAPSPAALTRASRRRALGVHAALSSAAALVLVVVWAATPHSLFWPVWPLLALGLLLAGHGLVVLVVEREDVPGGRPLVLQAGLSGLLVLFLVGVWGAAGGGYFWPLWPLLGLSALALGHALVVPAYARRNLHERIDVLETTRAGVVDVQESELRRIERDLHDGAQARLVALGMSIGMAEQKLAEDPDAARALLAEARLGATEALVELRDLARGIHPPVLVDRGLGAAVTALAHGSPLRVAVSVEVDDRPAPAVETAAYFVVAEALANAGKHSGAEHVGVRIRRAGGMLSVEVEDDGRGGADPAGGGLTGLRRRVEALDGRFAVESPAGGPTVVRAELPCAS